MRRGRWGVVIASVALATGVLPRAAVGQVPEGPYQFASGRVTIGGELTAVAGERDSGAFFNYTDYEHNALRLARLRLLGEWRIHTRVSLLGEVRTENGNGAQVSAFYVRWRPWTRRDFDLQAGRIPPVIGAFARRAYGRDNPLIGTPLAYQYLTSLRPDALPATADDLLRMRARGWQPSYPIGSQTHGPGVPLVSSFRWDTGLEAHWAHDWLEFAGAFTLGAPAAPLVHEIKGGREWSGRVAAHGPAGLTLGLSGARGPWIGSQVLQLIPESLRASTTQSVVGADVEVGYLRWLVRAEWLRSVFQLPLVGNLPPVVALPAWSSFIESRYRLHPRWDVALRVDRLAFGELAGTVTGRLPTRWDAPVDRIEGVVGFRAFRNLEVRTGWQQNWRDGGRVRARGFPALQLLYWF